MNKLYAQRNGVPVDNTKQTKTTRAVEKLIVRNPYKREKTEEIPVPKLVDDYKMGDYADIIFYKMGSASYKMELIGHTPPEFVATNGEDIY